MPLTITFEAVLKPKNAAESLFGWILDPASDQTKGIKDFSVSLETMKNARLAMKKAGFSIITFSVNGNYMVCHGLTHVFESLFNDIKIYDYGGGVSISQTEGKYMIDIRKKEIKSGDPQLKSQIEASFDGFILSKPERIINDEKKYITQDEPPPVSDASNANNFLTRSKDQPVPLDLIEKLGGNDNILKEMGWGEGVNIGVIDTGWMGARHPYFAAIKNHFSMPNDPQVNLIKPSQQQLIFKQHLANFEAQLEVAKKQFQDGDYQSVKSFLLKFFPWEDTEYTELAYIDLKKQGVESEQETKTRVKNALQPYYDKALSIIKDEIDKLQNFMYALDEDYSSFHGTKIVFQILPFAPKARINVYQTFETLGYPDSVYNLLVDSYKGKDDVVNNSWGKPYEEKIKNGEQIEDVPLMADKPLLKTARQYHTDLFTKYLNQVSTNKNKHLVFHAAANFRVKTIFQERPDCIISVGGAYRKAEANNEVFAASGSSGYTYTDWGVNSNTTPLVCGWNNESWIPYVSWENTGLQKPDKLINKWSLTGGNSFACPQVVGIATLALSYLKKNKVPYTFQTIQDILKSSFNPITQGKFAQEEAERTAEKNTGLIDIFKVYTACKKLISQNKTDVKDTGKSNSLFW